jgi:hypothetical protein
VSIAKETTFLSEQPEAHVRCTSECTREWLPNKIHAIVY